MDDDEDEATDNREEDREAIANELFTGDSDAVRLHIDKNSILLNEIDF